MSSKKVEPEANERRAYEPGFFAKMRGALLLSGGTFSQSYRSTKLWQGYLFTLFCIGLLSLVFSTSTYPLFTDIFPYLIFSVTIMGFSLWISFSPLFFIVVFIIQISFWFLLSYLIAHLKKLRVRRTAAALGFALTPSLILIFYLINKFILQTFKTELGPLLLGISIGWILLSGLIGLSALMGIEFAGLFNFAVKSIVNRRKRTYTAIIGITVAIGLIITPIPIISGYYTQLSSLAQQYQYAQYLIMLEQGKDDIYSSYINLSEFYSLNHANIEKLSPETYINLNLTLNSAVYNVNLRGINYSLFQSFRESLNFQILPAKTLSDESLFIGTYLATVLNISYSSLPINISLSYKTEIRNVTIVGLVSSKNQYDADLFSPINLTWAFNPTLLGKISLIEARLSDASKIDSTIETLIINYPNLNVKRENQLSDFISGIIDRTVQSIWLLSIVVYVVMAFGLFHIMNTIVRESEREIFILKAIGSSRHQITRIFLYQGFILSLIGIILGVFGGIFLSYSASYLVSKITTITVQPVFDIFIILVSIGFGITSGLLGSLYPAYRASKILTGGKG